MHATRASLLYRLAVVALIPCIAACSLGVPITQNVTVTVDPPAAEIFVNGNLLGTGTVTTAVPRAENLQVMARHEGYVTMNRSIGKHLNSTGFLDIIGGVIWLVPFIGLGAPGAYDLDETNIALILPEK